MSKQHDVEEQEFIRRHDVMTGFLKSEGWEIVKGALLQQLAQQNNLNNLDLGDDVSTEDVIMNLRATKIATDNIMDWIDTVHKEVGAMEENRKLLRKSYDEQFIVNYDG